MVEFCQNAEFRCAECRVAPDLQICNSCIQPFIIGEEVRVCEDEDVEAAARVLAGFRRPERASPDRPGQ